jgi:hypothetical protein
MRKNRAGSVKLVTAIMIGVTGELVVTCQSLRLVEVHLGEWVVML